jgi:quinol monooxygenase YgiN
MEENNMIIVSAKITTAPGKRANFIKEAQPCIAATRREDGCLLYELYASTDHPDKLMYFERWESRAALDKHMTMPHMAEFAAIKKEQSLQLGDTEVGIFSTAE